MIYAVLLLIALALAAVGALRRDVELLGVGVVVAIVALLAKAWWL